MDPTSHALTSLLPVPSGDARFAVMAPTPPEAVAWPSRNVAACSAVGGVAKSTTPLSRARHLPHFSLRLALLSFFFLCSPWTASEQFVLVGRIRELRSTDFKSTATKARQPS